MVFVEFGGTVSVGIFNQDPGLRSWYQIYIQLTGIGAACLWAFFTWLNTFLYIKNDDSN
jgi:hypothetical protein